MVHAFIHSFWLHMEHLFYVRAQLRDFFYRVFG